MGTRSIHKLTDREVKTAKPGLHADGGCLYLQVSVGPAGNLRRSWLLRFATGQVVTSRTGRLRKVEREMGLGGYPDVGLAEARERATNARRQIEQGIDPITARRNERASLRAQNAKAMTFDQCRDAFIAARRETWRNTKHADQWTSTLATYATPVFGSLPVQAVDVGLIMKVIEPLWSSAPETGNRVRGRIEAILNWATVRGYRQGDNPAVWRGRLDQVLPKVEKARKAKRKRTGRGDHHAALPFDTLPAFMTDLRERDGTSARALEFAILTAARTGEVVGARWDEIDLEAKNWTVPGDRMKGGKEHRVPLPTAAVGVLERMAAIRQNEFVFPGDRRAHLSNMALLMLLRRTGRGDLTTTHGFRSSFRTWAGERTSFPRELAEVALAHLVGDETERAYQRGDLLEKRRKLMEAWASFASKPASVGTVVLLKQQGAL